MRPAMMKMRGTTSTSIMETVSQLGIAKTKAGTCSGKRTLSREYDLNNLFNQIKSSYP